MWSLAAATLLAVALASGSASSAPPAPPVKGAFHPSADLDLGALERAVQARAPGVEGAALEVDLADAAVKKSRLLPNPSLDASWGTIPIGTTNPPNLSSPMTQIPNYSVGLSYTFPIGKRGPTQDRAEALAGAARAGLDLEVRGRAIDLARVLGALAATTLRLEGLRRMADDGKKQVELAEARVAAQFASELDVERLRVEASRLEQSLRSAESDASAAIASCSALLGASCEPFAGGAEARSFLARWIERAAPEGKVEERPDVRALAALTRAAEAEAKLAKAQAIPDPTVRLGYMRDQFVISGNQQNSVSVSVSIPLPLFDHGQAELAAAEARRARLSAQRDKTIEASASRVPTLRTRLEAQKKRQRALSEEILPRAESTLRDISRAAEARLVPLTDVVQARRTVSELLIEEADSFSDAFEASLQIAAELAKTNQTETP